METYNEKKTILRLLPPRAIWKEVKHKKAKEGEHDSYFIRVDENGEPLKKSQPDLQNSSVWTFEEIPKEDKVIWLDQKKNDAQIFDDLEKDVERIKYRDEIMNLRQRESALLTTNIKLVLRKISGIPKENLLSYLEKDSQGKYVRNRNDEINRLLEIRLTSNGLIPMISFDVNKVYFRTILPEPKTFTIDLKSLVNRSDVFLEALIELVKKLDFFIFSYHLPREDETADIEGHAVFFKRVNAKNMELINPQGISWGETKSSIEPLALSVIIEILEKSGITHISSAPCMRQSRGTCFLWAVYFAFNADKSTRQAVDMVDEVLNKHEMPINDENRDAVIVQLMYTFVRSPVEAANVGPEYTKGLGKYRKCRKCGLPKLLKGKAVPENLDFLQQMAKQSYNLVDPQEDINGWSLIRWTPTMKFYMKGTDVIVAIRGTKTNEDVMTWSTIPLSTLETTSVYKRDKAELEQFQRSYSPTNYNYYAVGHSLSGAIIDEFLRAGLIKEGLSYNPAIQYKDINAGLPNRRIYYGTDPLYKLMGWWDKGSEHREIENRTWAEFLLTYSLPAIIQDSLASHKVDSFKGIKGGKKKKKLVFT